MADITPVEGKDTEMIAAMEEARRRLPEFRKALEDDWQRVIPVIHRWLVKARFQSAATGKVEHVWMEVSGFQGDRIVGELANEPSEIPELSQGQTVEVMPAEVSDWIYWEGDTTVGGFTVAVLERREHE